MIKILIFAGTTEGRVLTERLLERTRAAAAGNAGAAGAGSMETAERGEGGWGAGRAETAVEITACVATEYGRVVLEDSAAGRQTGSGRLRILSGRLSEEEMCRLMTEERFDVAVDATHPYASQVTACIRQACRETHTCCLRLVRDQGKRIDPQMEQRGEGADSIVFVESAAEAADFLNTTEGPVLLTTGSKELAAFTAVEDFGRRLYARVLPMAEAVEACTKLGFQGRQLICMQGPFSYEMNAAMLKQTGARYLVSKETGKAGGFDEKLRAALDLGVRPVIIGRKPEEDGKSLEEVLDLLEEKFGVPGARGDFESPSEGTGTASAERPGGLEAVGGGQECSDERDGGPEDWFPLFINIKDRPVIVVGAGRVAARRIRTLLQFSCRLTVIAPEVSEAVEEAAKEGRLRLVKKAYGPEDLLNEDGSPGAVFVLAAVSDRQCSSQVVQDCRRLGIPVNTADCRAECDFYFPGVAAGGGVVAGVTACGRDHSLAKEAAGRVREVLAQMGQKNSGGAAEAVLRDQAAHRTTDGEAGCGSRSSRQKG